MQLQSERIQRRFNFPRCCRLTSSGDYRRVFANNTSIADKNFLLLARRSEYHVARLGLAVAKKHLKRASDRNAVKRIVRESFRTHQYEIGALDVVVLVKRGIDACDKQSLRKGLDLLWLKLRTKCDDSQHS